MTLNPEALAPCPFCSAEMRVGEHTAFHPSDEGRAQRGCWLQGYELDETDYALWNRRAPIQVRQVARLPFQFADEPRPDIPEGYTAPLSTKTTREMIADRQSLPPAHGELVERLLARADNFHRACGGGDGLGFYSGVDEQLDRAAATALSQQKDGWRPIESAPKDGTPVIGWDMEFGARETRSVSYQDGSVGHAKGLTDRWWTWTEEFHRSAHRWKPTHWMPLPAALATPSPQAARLLDIVNLARKATHMGVASNTDLIALMEAVAKFDALTNTSTKTGGENV